MGIRTLTVPSIVNSGNLTTGIRINQIPYNKYLILVTASLFSSSSYYIATMLDINPSVGLAISFINFGLLFITNQIAYYSPGDAFMLAFTGLVGTVLVSMVAQFLLCPTIAIIIMPMLVGITLAFSFLTAKTVSFCNKPSLLESFILIGVFTILIIYIALSFIYNPAALMALFTSIVFLVFGFRFFNTTHIFFYGDTNYARNPDTACLTLYNLLTAQLCFVPIK